MQAAGVVAAGTALDLDLPRGAVAASSPPIGLPSSPSHPSPYGAWTDVHLPQNTNTLAAMQCFGFNGSTLYVCQNDGNNPTKQLTFSQYSGGSYSKKYSTLKTTQHGGQIGVIGSTIWVGEESSVFSGTISPTSSGGSFTGTKSYSVVGWTIDDLNTDGTYFVARDDSANMRLFSVSAVKTAGAFAANIGQAKNLGGSGGNIAFANSGTWLYYATQASAGRSFTAGYFNFLDGTTNSRNYTLPADSGSSYELEGMAIVGSTIVVGVNNGWVNNNPGTVRSFSLVKL